MKINFESKPLYGDDKKYIKIKIYADMVIFITKKNLKKKHTNVYQQ